MVDATLAFESTDGRFRDNFVKQPLVDLFKQTQRLLWGLRRFKTWIAHLKHKQPKLIKCLVCKSDANIIIEYDVVN
jgi:hypothetical protein